MSERGGQGGFGLSLVDRLSELWGTLSRHSGRTVFARVQLATGMAPAA
ncbi:hypothetical protein [Streptomyces anthocyanicus]|nr:hypothetical protein OH747_40645 [Streptomyces anthocyanicus]